jgi:hypothetical protein
VIWNIVDSGDLILAYWCVIDSCVTLFQHTEILLILMVPHSTIPMCYWFSWDLIPAYWCVIDSDGTAFQHTDVLTILVALFQHTEVLLILRWPHASILMFYWFSCDLIPEYWSIVDSHGTSFQHTNWCVIFSHVTSSQHTNVLLILRWSHPSILMFYWFSWYLIPVYWCVIDSHVTSSQHTNVLLILMWPHHSILRYCWFSWYLIPQY